MKTLEKILILMVLVGLFLKFFFIPGAHLTMFISLTLLSLFYFILSFAMFNDTRFNDLFNKSTYSNMNTLRLIGLIALGISLSSIIIGFLFKLFRWPGANIQLLSGLILTFIILIISIIKGKLFKSAFYKPIQVRLIAYLVFGVFLYSSSDYWMEEIKYRNNPEFLEIYIQHRQNPNDVEVQKKYEKAIDIMIYGEDVEFGK